MPKSSFITFLAILVVVQQHPIEAKLPDCGFTCMSSVEFTVPVGGEQKKFCNFLHQANCNECCKAYALSQNVTSCTHIQSRVLHHDDDFLDSESSSRGGSTPFFLQDLASGVFRSNIDSQCLCCIRTMKCS